MARAWAAWLPALFGVASGSEVPTGFTLVRDVRCTAQEQGTYPYSSISACASNCMGVSYCQSFSMDASGTCHNYQSCNTIESRTYSHGDQLYFKEDTQPPPSPPGADPTVPYGYAAVEDTSCPIGQQYTGLCRTRQWCADGCSGVSYCQSFAITNPICGTCKIYAKCRATSERRATQGSTLFVRLPPSPSAPPPALPITGSGVVVDAATGKELERATVAFSCGSVAVTAVTTSDGSFSAAGLPPGPCTVRLSLPGSYFELTTAVTLTSSAAANAAALSFSLSKNDLVGTNKLRFVVSWGLEPKDLDAHLVGCARAPRTRCSYSH